MKYIRGLLVLSCVLLHVIPLQGDGKKSKDEQISEDQEMQPTVTVVILIRNKEHILSYFLNYLERLDYPKNRMDLWIRSDHNSDTSTKMIEKWIKKQEKKYHFIDFKSDDTVSAFEGEADIYEWTEERVLHIQQLRTEAFAAAEERWTQFLLYVDVDNLLLNHDTLKDMVAVGVDRTFVTVQLSYSSRHKEELPSAECLLVNMNYAENVLLNFGFNFPEMILDPYPQIVVAEYHASRHGTEFSIPIKLPISLLNEKFYGFTLPEEINLVSSHDEFITLLMDNIDATIPLQTSKYAHTKIPLQDKLGLDEIYVVNLQRRPERKNRLTALFQLLGIKAKFTEAVDARDLTKEKIDELGVVPMEGYYDVHVNRPMTKGEIGCFLSHYNIWKDAYKNKYERVLIFEDDARFEPYFRRNFYAAVEEADNLVPNWELLFVSRRLYTEMGAKDDDIEGAEHITRPGYSYWLLSYVMTKEGLRKLLEAKPLSNLIPADEFVPVMYDADTVNDTMRALFPKRDLVALAMTPSVVFPQFYNSMEGYVSDTEWSDFL